MECQLCPHCGVSTRACRTIFTVPRHILLGGGGRGLCQCKTHYMTMSAVIIMSHVHLSIPIHIFQMDNNGLHN